MLNFKKAKYLILLLIIILFPLKVKAFSKDTTYNVSMCEKDSCSTTESKGMYLFDGSYDGNWYYLKDNSMVVRPIRAQNLYYNTLNTDVLVYHYHQYIKINGAYRSGSLCIDPVLSTSANVNIKRQLNPNVLYNGNLSKQSTYDAAALYILKSGYSIATKETALRLITSAWNFHNVNTHTVYNSDQQAWDFLNAYSNTAESILNSDATLKEKWKTVSGQKSIIKHKDGSSTRTFFSGGTPSYAVFKTKSADYDLNNMKKLFKEAIEEAYKLYTSNNVNPGSIFGSRTMHETEVIKETDGYYLERKFEYQINTEGLSSLKITGITSKGVTISLDNAKLNENLVGKTRLKFTAKLKEDLADSTSNGGTYAITFKYCDKLSSCKNAYVFHSNDDTGNEFQRLIWYDEDGILGEGYDYSEVGYILLKRPCDTTMSISNNCDVSTTGKIETKNDQLCYTNNNDDVGNTYKVNTSKYEMFKVDGCANIYCKEDYSLDFMPTYNPSTNQTDDKFIYTTSGRYFKLQAKIKGTLTCYADINSNENKSCKNLPTKVIKTVLSGNQLDTNFFDTNNVELQYKYSDYYSGNEFTNMTKTVDVDSIEIDLCSDGDSECNTNSNNKVSSKDYISESDPFGLNSRLLSGANRLMKNASDSEYIKLTIGATATYTSKNQYKNYYTSGNVYKANSENDAKTEKNLKYIDGLPIKIDTDKGLYNYQFKITNLGDYFDTGKSGRLIGNSNSVYKKLYSTKKTTFNGEYMCYYFVNCQDCTPTCKDYTCTWNPNCPTCNNECINCLYDGNKLKVTFRQITTENLNPNERTQGYNWNTNNPNFYKETEWNFTNLKARATEAEIESSSTQIEQETPILKVDMTYDMAKYIKSNTSSSYSDDTLVCYNYEENGKIKYENLFCYSTLLDDLETKYSSNITFINTRTKSSKRTNKNVTSSGYWTLFDSESKLFEEDKNKTYVTATTFDFNSASHIGGPSWK